MGVAGVGPIPESAVDRWTAGMGPEEAVLFKTCVRIMESELRRADDPEPLRPGALGEMLGRKPE